MDNTINEIIDYVAKHGNYRATIGLIKTRNRSNSFLTWAAVNRETGEQYVPYLSILRKLHPEAKWSPLTPKELQEYLKQSKQEAFVYSEQKQA